MENESHSLWFNFKNAFALSIQNLIPEDLRKFKIPAKRTRLYKNTLMTQIAQELGLHFINKEEFLRIDYTLYKIGKSHKYPVPLIFIESENVYSDAIEKEILKLCATNSMLKVLILNFEWKSDSDQEIKTNDFFWNPIFHDYLSGNMLIGDFGVLVLSATNKLTIRSFAYDNNGELFDEHNIILEKEIL